jgi:hypothetical protein
LFSFFDEKPLKNEKNEKFKKRDHSLRYLRKKTIFNLLFFRSIHREGTTRKEIQSKLKVTGRTVSNILSELSAEDKVSKSKSDKKYYVKSLFIDNGWSVFSEFLTEFQRQTHMSNIPLRRIYARGNVFADNLENEIFNFGNIIGAFMGYIMVESLRPNEKATGEDRYDILTKFLRNAVDMNSIFLQFQAFLPKDSTNRLIMGLDSQLLEKIMNAYDQAYPGFRELLDDSFREHIRFSRDNSCDHEWHKINVHKIGVRFECHKCLGLVEEHELEPSTT